MRIETDVLIIGSGIAGLRFAIEVSKFAEVFIVTKKIKPNQTLIMLKVE